LWDDDGWADGRKRPARPGWGCALAAIVGSVAVVVAAVLVIKLLAGLVDVSELSP
jgi:hypothetical protein